MEKEKKVHPTLVTPVYNSNFELGGLIAELRYDQICELFSGFILEAKKQQEGDKGLGKKMLVELNSDAILFAESLVEVYALLTISCEPFMKEEFAKIPISTAVLSFIKEQE